MAGRDASLIVLPPPGPLAWLAPELQALELAPPASAGARVIDAAARTPADLLAAALETGVRRLCFAPSPRAAAYARELSRCAGSAGCEIDLGGAGAGIALESRLIELAAVAPPGLTVLAAPDQQAAALPLLEPAPLSAGALRLLPLPAGPLLAEALERALAAARAEPERARAAGVVPYFVTAAEPAGDGAADTRLPATYFGILPGDRYDASIRRAARELFRRLQPRRSFHWLALENFALLGVDVYADAIARRATRAAPAPAPARHRPLVFAIEGGDGSGKSTHVAALREHLAARGLSVAVRKMYRHGTFHDTVTDLCRQCEGDKNLHLWRIERLAKVFDSVKYFATEVEPALGRYDALVFDRWIHTHLAAGAGRAHYDPGARELLQVYPAADRVFLLDTDPARQLARIGERAERTVDENPYMLGRYRHHFLGMAAREGLVVLDAAAPFADNAARIRAVVDQAIRDRAEARS